MALNFPAKIYQILENESADIIRWHSNGMAFRIVDHGRFEREIIPKYFRHNQISSVQRQLNLYGFKCISRGEDKGAFYHQKFKRGDWEIVKKITRYAPVKKVFPDPSNLNSSDAKYDSNGNKLPSEATDTSSYANGSTSINFGTSTTSSYPQTYNANNYLPNNTPWQWYDHPAQIYPFFHHQIQNSNNHNQNNSSVNANTQYVIASNNTNNSSVMSVGEASNNVVVEVKEEMEMKKSVDIVKEQGYVKVINDVVTVDPYFDFNDDFEMFKEVDIHFSSSVGVSCEEETAMVTASPAIIGSNTAAVVVPSISSMVVTQPGKVDMGTNTDLTQAGNLDSLYQACYEFVNGTMEGEYSW